MNGCGDGSTSLGSSSAEFTTLQEVSTVADALSRVQAVRADTQKAWSLGFVRKQQDSCPTLSKIKFLMASKATPPENVEDMELKFFYKELPKLSVGKDGILRHSCSDDPGSEQIVLP